MMQIEGLSMLLQAQLIRLIRGTPGTRGFGWLGWGIVFGWLSMGLCTAVATSPPNIVLILGDDQAYTDHGFAKHPTVRTPHLDRLAAESLHFSRGVVPSSLCRPSLATLLTGRYPQEHGITGNDPPYPPGKTSAQAMADPAYRAARGQMVTQFQKSPNWVRSLSASGYRSFQTGKWWEGDPKVTAGFTEAQTHGDLTRGGRHGDAGLSIGRQGLAPIDAFLSRCQADGKPFVLWYAPMMPHQPHNPPPRWLELYQPLTPSIHVAKYWAMCSWFDETVGQLLAMLKTKQLESNTLVLFLNDNGWIQDPERPAYAPRSKQSVYEPGLRTPILLRWPGTIPPGERTEWVSSIDLMPTILAAAGQPIPPGLPGLDLRDPAALEARESLPGAIFLHTAKDITRPAENLRARWLRQGDWKIILPHRPNDPEGVPELFHLGQDPGETRNLAAQEPERVRRMTAQLDHWWTP